MDLDFFKIKERSAKNGVVEVYPDYRVCRSKDLMIRSKSFYAIWDEHVGLWSTDEYDVQRLIDKQLWAHRNEAASKTDGTVLVKLLSDFSSNSWLQFRNYVGHLSDSATQLDENLTFLNTEVKKSDYVSRRLPYSLEPGSITAWDEIVGTLYDEEERAKIEWAIGAIVTGDSKKIQKFFTFYGAPGTGKGTILDIIQKLFVGYTDSFEAKTLTGSSSFAVEAFKGNPLVAIDADGDLSKIEDNTRLNSIVSHEPMIINEKYKASYTAAIHAMLFVAVNKPVKFTDAKSGLIRRMIDVRPSGELIAPRKYQQLVTQVQNELGAIAHHCRDVYQDMGRHYYSEYRPVEMMLQTDVFFNYIESHYDIFTRQGGVTLNQAHELWRVWVEESDIEWKMPKYKLREELKSYFGKYDERYVIDNVRVRSWYSDFNADHWKTKAPDDKEYSLVLEATESLFDKEYSTHAAQYSKPDGTPMTYWTDAPKINKQTGKEFIPKPHQVVSTTLSDIDTSKEHYVKPPLNHIVIDFDLKDASGEKSATLNLEAASKWPSTYAEFSKSGAGVHLHYNYESDANTLSRIFDDGIEIKVFTGDSSLRRRLSKCNDIPIASLNSGFLPIKEKKVLNPDTVMSERAIRSMIDRNLRKEFHPGTKPSMDFIHKILNDAYYSDAVYDVSDMRPTILAFAAKSSNQALYCIKIAQDIKWKSEGVDPNPTVQSTAPTQDTDERVVIFDVEVFPNLFVVCWKYEGAEKVVRMINPTAQAVEELIQTMKLVGFNNRRYDNHILYAASIGYTNEQLYVLSKKIIDKAPNAFFGQAFNLSYTDIFDFASAGNKKGLKKWQIELDLHHMENNHPWDLPVDPKFWNEIADYCCNDVISTEVVFHHLKSDFMARQILADLSGLSVNDTTNAHSTRIMFGEERKPQSEFIYTDLSEMFPGYKYDFGKSTYRDEITGEGGYVYAEPGMYTNVALLDVESMHPASIEAMNVFGTYTKQFSEIKNARVAIKKKDFAGAAKMLGGKLEKYLGDQTQMEGLSDALKTVINSVYGLTSASFDNAFKDPRNIDNIVAKRGALFMVDLKHAVQAQGFIVAHIKTDSIKIPDATPEIIAFVMEFGKKYGYKFEHEATYEKMTLVNKAVYIAKVGWAQKANKIGKWEATGAQFAHPYVFKTLFSRDPIEFKDMCEAKFVTTSLYLDFTDMDATMALAEPDLHFVGRAGNFCPMVPGSGAGVLLREKDGKYSAAGGTKGYLWMESEMVKTLEKENLIDKSYFKKLVDDALGQLQTFGDAEQFVA